MLSGDADITDIETLPSFSLHESCTSTIRVDTWDTYPFSLLIIYFFHKPEWGDAIKLPTMIAIMS